MSKQRKSFLIYIDTLPLFDELNDADELSLCRAINHYHRDLPIELTEVARPLFRIFQAQFERDNERYAARCEKNRASVLKRYERQQSNTDEYECKQPNTDSTDRDRDRDRDRDSDRDRGRERDINPLSFKFSPYCSETMPEELRQAAEALNFQGDAEAVYLRFRDYWLQRETKKADWVSAWRNWLSREKSGGTVAERNARILNRRYGNG